MYTVCILEGREEEEQQCFSTTVKGMEIQYLDLDHKLTIGVWSLQEQLDFPSDIDLANAIDYNILGTRQYNRWDMYW